MSLGYAQIRLAEWGRWNRDSSIGYPSCSAGFGGVGRSTGTSRECPIHIELVDVIVRQMEVRPRRILIVSYTQRGAGRDKAQRLELPYSSYRRELRNAQEHVGIELEYAETYGQFDHRNLAHRTA